jgi:uncharacterized protein
MTKENLYTINHIRTFSGIYINPTNPKPELITIEDIAHSLSMQPRFGGHLPVWYSVAQHCVGVAQHCKKDKLQALLHDASEAYLMDIPSPIKCQISNYKEIECKLMECIALKFGFNWPLSDEVKEADRKMLEWEWDYKMIKGKSDLPGWPPHTSKHTFLKLFAEYYYT